jgi:3-methyladenine DNA glycosylase AlkD
MDEQMQASLEERILAKVRNAKSPITARQVARLLCNHAAYKDTLREIDKLITTGVLETVQTKYTDLLTLRQENG